MPPDPTPRVPDPGTTRTAHRVLHQADARHWAAAVAAAAGRTHATLADVPDADLDALADRGIDWLYLLGVWCTGPTGRVAARVDPGLRRAYRQALPDLEEGDVVGSPFAPTAMEVTPTLGGDAALADLRARLHARGIGLVVDLVPNHVGLDHPWLVERPDLVRTGTTADLLRDPAGWVRRGDLVVAHGRDPSLPPWRDTAQLDAAAPAYADALLGMFRAAADRADGVRIDMAMLLLPEVFRRTWGDPAPAPVWPDVLARVRASHPDLLTIAEVYWDLEARLLDEGVDLAYDKPLRDALLRLDARAVRRRLLLPTALQQRLVRFVENHDEVRVAAAVPREVLAAVTSVALLAPGLAFVQRGQREGARVRTPVQLRRAPDEPVDREVVHLHDDLARATRHPAVRSGEFALLDHDGPEHLLVWAWRPSEAVVLVAVCLGTGAAGARVRVAALPVDATPEVLAHLGRGTVEAADGQVDVALGPGAVRVVTLS
jgi:hypothetical protein